MDLKRNLEEIMESLQDEIETKEVHVIILDALIEGICEADHELTDYLEDIMYSDESSNLEKLLKRIATSEEVAGLDPDEIDSTVVYDALSVIISMGEEE